MLIKGSSLETNGALQLKTSSGETHSSTCRCTAESKGGSRCTAHLRNTIHPPGQIEDTIGTRAQGAPADARSGAVFGLLTDTAAWPPAASSAPSTVAPTAPVGAGPLHPPRPSHMGVTWAFGHQNRSRSAPASQDSLQQAVVAPAHVSAVFPSLRISLKITPWIIPPSISTSSPIATQPNADNSHLSPCVFLRNAAQ